MKTKKCMMIEDCDGYKYFTFVKNYRQLIEFANKLNAEISMVTVAADVMPPLLDLVDLAKALTNQDYKVDVPYTVIETKIKKHLRNKTKTATAEKTRKAETIRNHIRELFLCQKHVSATDVAYHFKTYDFLLATYKNHILAVRKELSEKGYNVAKTSPGRYRIIEDDKPKKRTLSVMDCIKKKQLAKKPKKKKNKLSESTVRRLKRATSATRKKRKYPEDRWE